MELRILVVDAVFSGEGVFQQAKKYEVEAVTANGDVADTAVRGIVTTVPHPIQVEGYEEEQRDGTEAVDPTADVVVFAPEHRHELVEASAGAVLGGGFVVD